MTTLLLVLLGKSCSFLARLLNLGNGSTWPGHIALKVNKHFVRDTLRRTNTKIILVAGTNGKTTTSKLIRTILEKNGKTVLQNQSGANLLNGIASTIVLQSNLMGKINQDYALFEVDENALPHVLKEVTPDYILLLNLFRDQLDRYGEVRTIASHWKTVLEKMEKNTTLILNADDPEIAFLGKKSKAIIKYFGLDDKTLSKKIHEHAVDSLYCPECGNKLTYKNIYLSHLGEWACDKCHLKRPKIDLSEASVYPLEGIYNRYNVLAADLLTKELDFSNEDIKKALHNFKPAFGRQETISFQGKNIQIFLSKNPTGFNESLRTIAELGAKHLLIVLNDRIPDGRDISWIWDIELEQYINTFETITVTGDRVFDMALRIKYAQEFPISNFKFQIEERLEDAIQGTIDNLPENKTLYILPTYSAMLEVRKIITGRKIL